MGSGFWVLQITGKEQRRNKVGQSLYLRLRQSDQREWLTFTLISMVTRGACARDLVILYTEWASILAPIVVALQSEWSKITSTNCLILQRFNLNACSALELWNWIELNSLGRVVGNTWTTMQLTETSGFQFTSYITENQVAKASQWTL